MACERAGRDGSPMVRDINHKSPPTTTTRNLPDLILRGGTPLMVNELGKAVAADSLNTK
jgi:hypothetical protein